MSAIGGGYPPRCPQNGTCEAWAGSRAEDCWAGDWCTDPLGDRFEVCTDLDGNNYWKLSAKKTLMVG